MFKITHYCDCSICQGEYIGTTAIGQAPKTRRTIAVDPTIIPLNSKVKIDGHTYIAEDVGGAIKNKTIDIFVSSHDEALKKGVKYKEVFIAI